MSTPKQKELLEYLGPLYTLKTIDGESCIYRKLNNRYDIEVCGTNYRRERLRVYVWDISAGEGPTAQIVDRVTDIVSEQHLKQVLTDLAQKYQV